MSEATVTEYRIEVNVSELQAGQEGQFRREASRAGFRVTEIHNGFALAIVELTSRQATSIRDGLSEIGIHSSIGITNRGNDARR